MRKKRVRMSKSLLPKPSKIIKRGIYEIISNTKPRDYKKRMKEGKY